MNKKHLIILSAILVLLFSCTDPIEIPTSKAMETPASVLRNIVEEHPYKDTTKSITRADTPNNPPPSNDDIYRTILAYDLSRLPGLEFNTLRTIKKGDYDYSPSTYAYFVEKMPGLSKEDIKKNLEPIVFTAVQVNRIDDTHADVYFAVSFGGIPVVCLLRCTLNEFGIFDTESLAWNEMNGNSHDIPGYEYSKTNWGVTQAETQYLAMQFPAQGEPKFMAASKTIMNATGKKYEQYLDSTNLPEDFTRHGETQENMLKALFAWKASISK